MTLGRRSFLSLIGGAPLAWPRVLEVFAREIEAGGAQDDEAFWTVVRGGFSVPANRIYLNNGTLGPSPRVVVDAVVEHTRRVAETYPPGVSWDDLKRALSELLGGDEDGFVFPRNTTEGMSFVANGLDLPAGSEIVTTDHEHIGGLEPWRLLAARRGASLRVASLPVPAESPDALLEAVWAGVTPATRVLSVSHMTFTTGTLLPVRALAGRCREAGIAFVVDGAHPPGMLRIDIGRTGADFYASSPHKWLLAPQGTGLLWIAPEWRERLWPTLASGGWDDVALGAHRLNHMGTFDESRLAGLLAAMEFMRALGPERVEARVRYLAGRLRTGLQAIPGLRLATPDAQELRGGMVSFRIDGVESAALQGHLSRVANARTRVVSEYDYGWMRLSTHLYNTPSEIDRVLELLDEAARWGLSSSGEMRPDPT